MALYVTGISTPGSPPRISTTSRDANRPEAPLCELTLPARRFQSDPLVMGIRWSCSPGCRYLGSRCSSIPCSEIPSALFPRTSFDRRTFPDDRCTWNPWPPLPLTSFALNRLSSDNTTLTLSPALFTARLFEKVLSVSEALVRFVEDDAAAAGRGAMQLEVLESQPIHPHLSRVREWYERRGYRETSRLPLAALNPDDAARLLVAVMDVVTMRKP